MMNNSGSNRRVVVVTGASRGIGAAIAERFDRGGDIVISTDLDPDSGSKLPITKLDVTSADDVDLFFRRILDEHGRIDALVNNAGIWFRRPFSEISVDEWDRVFDVNLRGTFLCIKSALPAMEQAGQGVVINIGSQAGLSLSRGQGAHYHASKAAISHLTRVLGYELGPLGIRVMCVAPGSTPVDPSRSPEEFVARIPLGRVGTPDDVAEACWFFASDAASYVTGQTLLVNGGSIAYL